MYDLIIFHRIDDHRLMNIPHHILPLCLLIERQNRFFNEYLLQPSVRVLIVFQFSIESERGVDFLNF